jgi:hypothetical protein
LDASGLSKNPNDVGPDVLNVVVYALLDVNPEEVKRTEAM